MAYLLISILLLVVAVYLVIARPATATDWLEVSALLLPLLFLVMIAVMSRHKYNKVKHFDIPNSEKTIADMDHVVLKKDATFFMPQLLCFEKNGQFLGTCKVISFAWWHYPLALLGNSFVHFVPLTYGFFSNQGELLFTFERTGIKKTTLIIHDTNGNKLGRYLQEDFKSLVHIKGELFDDNDQLILSLKVSGMTGDFDIRDENDQRWAYFFNGRFPHEYTTIFREVDNDIVEISDHLLFNHKRLLLAVIAQLFITKNR